MPLEKRTIKIIMIVIVAVFIIGGSIGLLVHLLSPERHVRLEFIPQAESGSPLIHYKSYDKSSVWEWVKIIDDFLNDYRKKDEGNRVACSPAIGPLGQEQVCDVPIDDYHPCTTDNQYNYMRASPCVFLKLNKIVNWTPQPYNNTMDLPDNMPEDLKQYIGVVSDRPEANAVWVSCDGQYPADKEYIGPLQYIPRRGFMSYYFPYTNQKGYLSPLVAVFLERPMTGVLINVECKVWARNIDYDHDSPQASIVFQLMVD